MSLDRLIEAIEKKNNPSIAGLDPNLEIIPRYLIEHSINRFGKTMEAAADAILTFNMALIDALHDIVPAVKPQCAYYELYGWQGIKALVQTISYAKQKGMFVITDGKRNDIGSTMLAYANAHLGMVCVDGEMIEPFGADALTINGYLGSDGIKPLIDVCLRQDKGIFVLCKTSNKSSGELQDKIIGTEPVYSVMGQMCEQWGNEFDCKYGYSGVGAVVGATYPQQLIELRAKMPKTFFLVPGYGVQGGTAGDIAAAFDKKGRGAIVNSSRGIMCAYKQSGYTEKDFATAARNEAIRMRDEINSFIPRISLV